MKDEESIQTLELNRTKPLSPLTAAPVTFDGTAKGLRYSSFR